MILLIPRKSLFQGEIFYSTFIVLSLLYNIQLQQINIKLMSIQTLIVVCILLATSFAKYKENSEVPETKLICEYGFDESQWQSQQAANNIYMTEARKTFKTPSNLLISKVIRYLNAHNQQMQQQQLLEFMKSVTPQVSQYNAFYKYLLFLLTVLFVSILLKIFRNKGSSISINSERINKTVKICLLICAVVTLYLSVHGYIQGKKTEKTLSRLVCKLFAQPKGIIKGGNGPLYDGYHAYIQQMKKYFYKFSTNFQNIKQLMKKQYIIKQMIEFGKQIAVLTKENEVFNSQINKTVSKLEEITSKFINISKSIRYNRTLQVSRLLMIKCQYSLKTIQNYAEQQFSFKSVVNYIGSFIRIFYTLVFVLSLMVIIEVSSSLFKIKRINFNKSIISNYSKSL